jgi:hypothetical protein
MKSGDEFSFANAISIHRLAASGRAKQAETFLNEKHPKIHSFTYSGWRRRRSGARF